MKKNDKDISVKVGDISGVSGGQINIAGGNISLSQKNDNLDEIATAFATITKTIEKIPEGPDREIAKSTVIGLENEARKGKHANKTEVKKWFQFLAQIAPDAFEVAIDTFINPIKGLHTVFQKIAKQAKENRG